MKTKKLKNRVIHSIRENPVVYYLSPIMAYAIGHNRVYDTTVTAHIVTYGLSFLFYIVFATILICILDAIWDAYKLKKLNKKIETLFEPLEPLERKIIMRHFGFAEINGYKPCSPTNIGKKLNMSNAQVQDIIANAIRKMRTSKSALKNLSERRKELSK